MKTLSVIFLVTIYSISSFGLGVEKFYCCGHLKSVSLSMVASEKNTCGKDGATSGCCKTKFQSFKVDDNHLLAVNTTVATPPSLVPILSLYEPIGFFKSLMKETNKINYSPPPLPLSIPLYISNSVFRI